MQRYKLTTVLVRIKTNMWYLAWCVITGQHHQIGIQFMLPGQTHKIQTRLLFKKYYLVQNSIDTLEELVKCVRMCGKDVTCVPQLCSDWSFYNWDAYLSKWFIPLVGKQVYHIFSFHKSCVDETDTR